MAFKKEITGLDQTLRIMRAVDKEIAQELNRNFKQAGQIIADAARPKYPRRSGRSRQGVRVYIGGGKRRIGGGVGNRNRRSVRMAGFRVVQTAKGGSILEFALQNRTGTKQAESLVENITRKYGRPGRFLWQAYDENKDAVDSAFEKSVRDAEAKLNAKVGVKVFER